MLKIFNHFRVQYVYPEKNSYFLFGLKAFCVFRAVLLIWNYINLQAFNENHQFKKVYKGLKCHKVITMYSH